MRRTETDCVNCGLPCVGYCAYKNSETIYLTCDKCGSDAERLYKVDYEELCRECAISECKDELVKYAEEESGEEVDEDFIDDDVIDEFLGNMFEVITDD